MPPELLALLLLFGGLAGLVVAVASAGEAVREGWPLGPALRRGFGLLGSAGAPAAAARAAGRVRWGFAVFVVAQGVSVMLGL